MTFALTPPEEVVHVRGDKLGRSYTPRRVADAIVQRLAPPEGSKLFDFSITNPPFGLEVGQDVTVGIVAKARKAARVCAMLMPTDYQTQAGFEEHVLELAEIWPVLPRPFPHERGMCVYLWRQGWTRGALFRPLRWRAGRFPNHLGRRS